MRSSSETSKLHTPKKGGHRRDLDLDLHHTAGDGKSAEMGAAVVVVRSEPCRAAYHTPRKPGPYAHLWAHAPSPTPPRPSACCSRNAPGVLCGSNGRVGRCRREASEVTLGGKAHVGPGCVLRDADHQPGCLDRGISLFPCIFCCVCVCAVFVCTTVFSFSRLSRLYIRRRSPEFEGGARRVFSGGYPLAPFPRVLLFPAYVLAACCQGR